MPEQASAKSTRPTLTATPNPVAGGAGLGTTTIAWDTADGSAGQVWVTVDGSPEALVSAGARGTTQVTWIANESSYLFRLYTGEHRELQLAEVSVTRAEIPWEVLAEQVLAAASKPKYMDDVAKLLAKLIASYAYPPTYQKYFDLWQEHGYHITPVHYYQPIPDTRTLYDDLWGQASKLPGVEMNDSMQLELARNIFPRFLAECQELPAGPSSDPNQFYLSNTQFAWNDALVLYCMVRHFQPNLIIEVGSGFSSMVSARAALRNGNTRLVCIEPYPSESLRRGFPGLSSLIDRPIQEVEYSLFDQLGPQDILFIDSSHVVRTGGDVNRIYLEILPRLNPGVMVHIHDIFLPFEYPRPWIKEELLFWSEQYLLQAFLAFNSAFEVVLANSYLGYKYPDVLQAAFPMSPWQGGGSFWIRRKTAD